MAATGLPAGWEVRHSNSKNLPYYFNPSTKESRWEPPADTDTETLKEYMATHHSVAHPHDVSGQGEGKIRCSHLLVKHRDSRRPSSWREAEITRSKEEAIQILKGYEERIQSGESLGDIAVSESDCSSARKKGDLGFFGHGEMQKEFEDAAFALQPGQVSGIVETASGVHLIQRRPPVSSFKTILSYPGVPEDFKPPEYLTIPDELRQQHARLADAAGAVINGLRILQGVLDNHLIGLCPEMSGPILEQHISALRRLDSWRENTLVRNPSLLPAAKIPSFALQLTVYKPAYEDLTTLFNLRTCRLLSREWASYCFKSTAIHVEAARRLGAEEYEAWLYWWRVEFQPREREWQSYVRRMILPTWEQAMSSLHLMIWECAEEPRTVIRNMMSSEEYDYHVNII
ncbi:Peptidyl-prolyl cis-trans isomerase ssp-1 [Penicillium oxalicum]|uniref:Peptidyl-prolyl cis-trans isomerase ssp-1 n=1 Tax=Penicillium oxalicum TaxID=69781 RepID=UPI0020B6CFD5|nr:Peptidyl-prolyl cis-trans isomerase ssp-1 [Penicillium oxalicum]KAI2787912.1 Peptidyl-prolyl cis-trans isomerase ssp-1 [Penicillium oxalicum]